MRHTPSALLSLSNLSTTNFSTLILCILILSTISFAAAPDRIAGPIVSSQTVALAKSLHPKADPQHDLGPVDPSRQLSYITLLMAPSANQQKALDRLLAQQQDPKSPNYHKWLTPQQYADRFGLSQNDLKKVTTWLGSQGFQILSIGGGRNSVIFSGTAAEVRHAFGTEIHSYRVNGEEHFANSSPLMMPSSLNGIVTAVIGLHDFRLKPADGGRRFAGLRNGRPDYYDGNLFFPNFLAPGDLATIYDITPLYNASTPIDGTGQKLAIVGQTNIYLADINYFRTDFGLSAIPTSGAGSCATDVNGIIVSPCTTTNFSYVFVGALPGAVFPGDLGESDLDIEQSGAVARNAQIIFVNGETNGGVLDALVAAINPPSGPPLAPVVSMSYGGCEAQSFDLETLLQQGVAEGVTIVNSSGDAGAATCDRNPNSNRPFKPAIFGLAVSYPASSPEVTGVGGTGISLANDSFPNPSSFWDTVIGANGGTAVSYIPELAWNDDEGLAQFCQAEPTITFCKQGNSPALPGWVPLTATATAAQVQSDIWISQGGGGASNCFTEIGGGLCQAGFPQPTWQQGLSVPKAPAGVRYVPDVSLLASPGFPGYIWCTPVSEIGGSGSTSTCASGIFNAVDFYGSIVGGTSASAPVFAGILTLVNQYLVQNGFQANPGLGNANPNLYHIATYNQTAFHQDKAGDNMVYCQPGTPAGQPTALRCPAAVPPATAGVFGYQASNADSATGYNLVTGLGSVDVSNLATAWADLFVTTTTSISTTAVSPVFEGQPVTFNVTVTPTTASGIVGFSNNGTPLSATAVVTGGAAQYTTTSLPVGTDNLTATYTGIFATSTSTNTATVTVVAPNFTLTPTAATISTTQGGTAGPDTITVTSNNGFVTGSQTAMPLRYSCVGLPSESSCSFNPTSPTSSATVAVSIKTTAPTAQLRMPLGRVNQIFYAMLLPGLFGIVLTLGSRKRAARGVCLLSFIVVLGLSTMWLAACGGGGGGGVKDPGTPKGSYTITINATTGTVQGTAGTVTLTVN